MATKKKTTGEKGTRKRYNCTPEQIVRAWQTSESVKEAAEKVGMTERALYSRIVNLRKKKNSNGDLLQLKDMGRAARYTPSYVDELQELAYSLNGV